MRLVRLIQLKACLTALVLAVALPASQAAKGQVYQVQQGHVLDANPQMGTGGLNLPARTYDFAAGNRIISGNVTGGTGFQGFSPIRSPSQLFVPQSTVALAAPGTPGIQPTAALALPTLPSEALSTFRRDTLSVADVQRGMSFRRPPQPYFPLQSTVTNIGAIAAGLNRPGTSQPLSPYAVPREDLRVRPEPLLDAARQQGNLLSVSPRMMRLDDGRPLTGEVNARLLGSGLFAGFREVPTTTLAWQAEREQALGAAVGAPLDLRVERLEPLDRRVAMDPTRVRAGEPLEPVAGRVPVTEDRPDQRWEAEPPQGRMLGVRPRPDVGRARPDDVGVAAVPNAEVFLQMRAATGQLFRPLEPLATIEQRALTDAAAPGEAMLRPLVQPTPRADADAGQMVAAAPPAEHTLQPSEMAPLETFVGTEPTLMNRYLAEAESRLQAGEYYRAAALYDVARSIQPDNPLPLLGRSMALLASGDYITSANNLFQAIQMFEALGHFQFDLTAFIPDLAALDRRRADLERRLEAREDFRLRFLLGYAEYNSGMEERGLQQMEEAAQAAPQELAFLQRFIQILRDRPERE